MNKNLAGLGLVLALFTLCVIPGNAQTATTLPSQFVFAGASYNTNSGSNEPVAVTFGYAHKALTDNTYPFVLYDAVPNSYKPFSVNSNVAIGAAQKLATVLGHDVYGTTGAGPSWQGSNLGWNWGFGATVPFKVSKKGFYILPTLRTQSSSVSAGSRLQVIGGLEFGFGK